MKINFNAFRPALIAVAALTLVAGAQAAAVSGHIVTNDDSNGWYAHLTQNLDTGAYTLLVSFCCRSAGYAENNGAPFSSTDEFNGGSYWFGGTGTLTGMQDYIAANSGQGYDSQPYALTISNVTLDANNVPEPTSLALVGLALMGLALMDLALMGLQRARKRV
ncbi:MAG: PEP-CTERM sorting domain-containing protein [Microbacteriaceae bacterium]|nr:PEP-CTERM sorting domain-containing protein [Burkholderiaceae bacterium]